MKTSSLRLFSLIAIFAMTLVSCSKDEAPTIDNNSGNNQQNNNQNNAPEARFTLSQKDTGEAITEGREIIFNEVNKAVYVKVKNKVNEEIKTKLLVEAIEGSDGSKLRMCYGLCSNGVTVGTLYPVGSGVIKVDALAETAGWDNFTQTQWDGVTTLTYKVKVVEVDNNGNILTNRTGISFKYIIKKAN